MLYLHNFTGIYDKQGFYKAYPYRIFDDKTLCGVRGYMDDVGRKYLLREIKEELNSEIEIVTYINEASYDYDFGTVVMKTYHAKLISGNLELLEHQNSTWLAPNELDTLNWAPVDRPAVELLSNK